MSSKTTYVDMPVGDGALVSVMVCDDGSVLLGVHGNVDDPCAEIASVVVESASKLAEVIEMLRLVHATMTETQHKVSE